MSEARKSEILSHAEIQALLERNNLHPEIGRPVYTPWSDNKGQCDSQEKLDAFQKNMNLSDREEHYTQWVKRLNSKQWKVQMKGKKEAELVTRQIRSTKGTWIVVPLNSKQYQ